MTKKKQLKWILLCATILTLGACSSDSELQEQAYTEVELRLSSSLDQRTRAAYTKTQDTQILSGENVYAWVDEAKSDGAIEYIQAWQLTADGSGNFSATQKTYPISGNPVNVYAVHGNFSTAPSGSFPTAALSHHVNVAQNTSAGYAASDLLYATGTNLARQTAAHQLTFRHLLSKIEVYLVAGIGTTDAELASAQVTIMNTKPTAMVTLSKTAAPTFTLSGTAVDISAKMQSQTDQTITIGSDTSVPVYGFAEAIIVPQWVNTTGDSDGSDVDFIKVTLGTMNYAAQVNEHFEAGHRYKYNVIVNKSGIELTSTISQWNGGGITDTTAQ